MIIRSLTVNGTTSNEILTIEGRVFTYFDIFTFSNNTSLPDDAIRGGDLHYRGSRPVHGKWSRDVLGGERRRDVRRRGPLHRSPERQEGQARCSSTEATQGYCHSQEANPGNQEQTGTEYTPTVLVINAPAQSWTGEIAVLVALSTDHPDLRILTRRGLTRTLIKAMTQDTLDTLLNLNQLQGKPVTFSTLETARSTTGIVQRVPAEITTALLRATNPKVRTAERMTVWDPEAKTTVETMSVKIVYEGTLPSSIPIGFLETFSVRPYTPDPIRCYKCQRYGHMSRMCHQRHSTCGICSGMHQTSVCVTRRKEETVVAKCFNCKGNHVTASKACPVITITNNLF